MIYTITENTEALNENIPRDLLNAYRKVTKYTSVEHPNSDHDEVSSDRRRSTLYAYGSAEYRVISVEEALRLIAEDPHNVEKIRGIRNGELVEYEYQNGKYYALYANPDAPVSYQKPDGTTVTKKNIRYITNPRIWLRLLDKIYYTNEYDFPIEQQEIDQRDAKKRQSIIATYTPGADPNFNQFEPFTHLAKNIKSIAPRAADTGNHGYPRNRFVKSARVDIDGIESKTMSVSNDVARDIDVYNDALDSKQNAFDSYTRVRKALKKLKRDKDDYDTEEYEELLAKWSSAEKHYLELYNQHALAASRLLSKLKKYSAGAASEFSQKFAAVIKALDTALRNCSSLKAKIEKLETTSIDRIANYSELTDNPHHSDPDANQIKTTIASAKRLSTEIDQLIEDIKTVETTIKEIQEWNAEHADSLPRSTTDEEEALQTFLVNYNRRSIELTTIYRDLMTRYLSRYKELQSQMLNVEAQVNAILPTRAAKKAAKAQAAGKAVLDPALTDIIQFVDEPEDSE